MTTAIQVSKPTLLFFTSPTDGRCRRAEGLLAQVLQRRGNHQTFRLSLVSADYRPDVAQRLRVDRLPTLLIVEDGRIRGRLVEPRTIAEIQTLLAPWLR
jgi:thioredoxin-like negative regulator of GroEL